MIVEMRMFWRVPIDYLRGFGLAVYGAGKG